MTTQTQIYPSLLDLSPIYPAICLDAYGVFWKGNAAGALPGSIETMRELVKMGKIVGILSNSTQLAEKEVSKLGAHGLRKGGHFHFLITSGEVARQVFLDKALPFPTPRNQFFVFSRNHPRLSPHEALFQNTIYKETDTIQKADFIYVGIPHFNGEDQIDPRLFQDEVRRIKASNLPMVCANPDRFAHEGNPPRPVVRQGGIAEMYQDLGGEVFYIGKPEGKVFQAAMEQFRQHKISDCRQVLMVGDTPETDIRGASKAGMKTALVVQTGNMGERVHAQGLDKAIQSLADLPDYYIQQLASHGI